MASYHKWDVKNDFVYVLQFFSLISDSLGSVNEIVSFMKPHLDLFYTISPDFFYLVEKQGVAI